MEAICPRCHVGALQRRIDTWARIVGPYLVTLPGIEVMICDACGTIEYDAATLRLISAILRSSKSLSHEKPEQPSPDRLESGWLRSWPSSRA